MLLLSPPPLLHTSRYGVTRYAFRCRFIDAFRHAAVAAIIFALPLMLRFRRHYFRCRFFATLLTRAPLLRYYDDTPRYFAAITPSSGAMPPLFAFHIISLPCLSHDAAIADYC